MRVIGTQPAGWNNAMNMGMQAEPLAPCVQHAEETDLCAEVSGIASNFEKSFGTGPKQQTVDDFHHAVGPRKNGD